jgi:hypothetical protein
VRRTASASQFAESGRPQTNVEVGRALHGGAFPKTFAGPAPRTAATPAAVAASA